MADEYEDDAGGGGPEQLIEGDEGHVDDSQLKIAKFDASKFGGAVATGEEDDDVLFSERAKLYVKLGAEFKERATGPLKLSLHRGSGKVRFLMRTDKILKLRANFLVDPKVELKPMTGSDKAFVLTALDFSDDTQPAGENLVLSIKFNTKELAEQFSKTYAEAKAINAKSMTGSASSSSALAGGGGGGGGSSSAASSSSAAAPASKPAAAPAVDSSGPIPRHDSLAAIYGAAAADAQAARYAALTERFKATYGMEPTFVVRAPGRVNLIGEHIDYHGYSVLPMALGTQDVVIAGAVAEGAAPGSSEAATIHCANMDPRYATATGVPTNPAAPVGAEAGVSWYKYLHCGYKGAFDYAAAKGLPGAASPKALRLLVDGSVPAGAGVSSSSALVVASLLATAAGNGFAEAMTRAELGEYGRRCELYIGTMSGGMDQAASAMGQGNFALRIDFEPLKATPVPLPPTAVFVVSNTLEESPKAIESEKRYNKRVTEGKLAAKLVAKGLGCAQWRAITTFRHLQETMQLPSPGHLLPAVARFLAQAPYSAASAAQEFGEPLEGLFEGDDKREGALRVLRSIGAEEPAFELLKRARHVCSEADRVQALQAACGEAGAAGGAEAQLAAMGRLMSESHASCRDDYECSSPGLNTLTELAMASGAYGSRLTGAGWGGCAVSLVSQEALPGFLKAMEAGYYAGKACTVATALFASAPGSGAAVYCLPTFDDL